MMVIAGLALVAGACGGEASLGVAEAWSRPALGPNGAVYLTIEGGDADTALSGVAASSDVHVMLVDLTEPIELGDTFDMTLTFDNGTELTTTVEVRDE